MVKCELPKLELWVRFPSPAPFFANYIFVRYNKNMEELEKKEEIEITQENATETKVKKQTLVSQKVTMTAFGLSIFLIFLAAIFDVIAFKDTILTFIGGIIISAAAFVVLCILFLISFILIFGFYLVKKDGFWPLPLSIEFFKEVMGEVKVTAEQIATFRVFRIILIVLCLSTLVVAIVGRVMTKKDIQAGLVKRLKSVYGYATAAIVLTIIGALVSMATIALTSAM